MASRLLKYVIAAHLLIGCTFAARSSQATPFVDVRASWQIGINTDYGPLPDGIVLSSLGSIDCAHGNCEDSAFLSTAVTASGHYGVSSTGSVVITNTTGNAFSGYLVFYSNYSSFNPGGPNVGIGIDDPLTQAASFSSSVSGEGVGDFHGCSVGFLGESGVVFSPTTCGVSSPDSSQTTFGIDLSLLGTNGSLELPYTIDIFADFVIPPAIGVPEPAGALVLLTGLAALARKRSRK